MVMNVTDTPRRAYSLGARAAQADERRDRMIAAAIRLLHDRPFEDVTLQAVADAADVSLKTVVRHFGTKDELVVACVRARSREESALRATPAGDVRAAVQVLAERYDVLGATTLRLLAAEERFPAVAAALAVARRQHLAWLAEVFAPWLPCRGARERARRLAQLFGATEIVVWHSWRTHLGLDRGDAEAALASTLTALVASWGEGGGDR